MSSHTEPAGATPTAASAELVAAVARVRAELQAISAAVAGGALAGVDEQELPELAASLFAVADAATAAGTVTVGQVDRSGALRRRGIVSTKSWLAGEARLHGREAAAVLARMRDLDDERYGEVRAAWLDGRASGAQVRAIVLGMRECTAHVRDPRDWAVLYDKGLPLLLDAVDEGAAPEDLTTATKRLLNALAPDGADRAAIAAYELQKLSTRTVGDQQVCELVLDTEGGALVRTALDAVLDRWHRGRIREDDPPLAGLADRRRTSRQHLDALALLTVVREWLGCTADEHAGRARGARPHLHVSVDLADLTGRSASGTVAIPGREDAVVPISTVARLACDPVVTTVLTQCRRGGPLAGALDALRGQSREILWIGRAQRLVTPRLWEALVARDRGCRFPGCRRDVTRCEAHHVQPWEELGPTDLDNLILVCSAHHHLLHEGRWRVCADDRHPPGSADYWTFRPPRDVARAARAPAWPRAA